jgi:hypothetical protein
VKHLLLIALLSVPDAALAQEAPKDAAPIGPPLSATAFEALVEGKTMDTHNLGGIYGVETFLPGRRAIWRDADQCLEGTWRPEGTMICFDYIGEPFPYCWTYHDQGDAILGFLDGDQETSPISLYPSKDFVTCEGFLGV